MTIEDLSLEDFNNYEEQVVEIYTRLMAIICVMINDEADNKQNTTEEWKNQNTRFF